MKRICIVALALVFAVGITGCVDRQSQKEAKETQKFVSDPVKVVTTMTTKIGELVQTVEITGSVVSSTDTNISPKSSGRIVAVYVKDGDPVKTGQIIAQQDTSTLNAQLSAATAQQLNASSALAQAIANARINPTKSAAAVQQAIAQLRSAQATLKKLQTGARPEERAQAAYQVQAARSSLETAKLNLDRQKQLFDTGVVSKQVLEQAQNQFDTAKAAYEVAVQTQLIDSNGNRSEDIQVAQEAVRTAQDNLRSAKATQQLDVLYDEQVQAAKANLDAAKANVAIARQAIEDATIRAPFAGNIAGKPLQVGNVAGPGVSIARVVGGQGAYFEGQINEDAISKVKVGAPVTVTVNALGNQTFGARVLAVNPLGSDIGRLFSVRIQFTGSIGAIQPGMFAKGEVEIGRAPNSIAIPVSAIVNGEKGSVVYVVENGKAKSVPVKTGIRQQDKVQVLGLTEGQKVVIDGQNNLSDGAQVRENAAGATSARNESTQKES